MGALGIQLLAFGGWSTSNQDGGGGGWKRRHHQSSLTLKDRLAFITPTWKQGGSLDYNNIFQEGRAFLEAYEEEKVQTVAKLADVLEHKVGLGVSDFDHESIAALNAMLFWRISDYTSSGLDNGKIILLVFSFGNEASCWDTSDCPLGPGSTNELLAATTARFVQQHHENDVRVLAQWEVATALWQNYNDTLRGTVLESFGTPGTYRTTAGILEEMLCGAWPSESTEETLVLLAHPDHLRRVFWTAQTMLKRRRSYLRKSCVLPNNDVRLLTAMEPYSLDWPSKHFFTNRSTNLFDSLELTKVHVGEKTIMTDWYDTGHLGFFDNDSDQEWTHDREKWIMYDHWAVLKSIVTETIDLTSISSAS